MFALAQGLFEGKESIMGFLLFCIYKQKSIYRSMSSQHLECQGSPKLLKSLLAWNPPPPGMVDSNVVGLESGPRFHFSNKLPGNTEVGQ